MEKVEDYGLDVHCTMILEEYREQLTTFQKMEKIVMAQLKSVWRRTISS